MFIGPLSDASSLPHAGYLRDGGQLQPSTLGLSSRLDAHQSVDRLWIPKSSLDPPAAALGHGSYEEDGEERIESLQTECGRADTK